MHVFWSDLVFAIIEQSMDKTEGERTPTEVKEGASALQKKQIQEAKNDDLKKLKEKFARGVFRSFSCHP